MPVRTGSGPEPLVEREPELRSLATLAEAAAGGDGRVVLIEGPAGIGKTRLLAEARRAGEAECMRVLSARGSELEREFPYGVVRQLYEPLLQDRAERERLLDGAGATAAPVFGPLGGVEGEDRGDTTFAAVHGLFWLTVNAAGDGSLLLLVDDVHWVDRPSLRYLAYLTRRLEGLPVLVAATLRSTEHGTDAALLAEIAHDPAATSIRPGPLSAAGVDELIRRRLDADAAPPFASACFRATGGNPLLLGQLLGSLADDGVRPDAASVEVVREVGPRAVARTVLLRLARLPEPAVRIARAVAVLGEDAQLPLIAQLAELPERDVADATAALAQAEILRREPPIGFVHPLVRDAVYHDLPPGERELAHARAAHLLQDAGAAPDQIATHLLLVPRRGDPWVVEVLLAAGRSAVRRGAAEGAAAYLSRALEEPPPDDDRAKVTFELGIAEVLTSGPASLDHLRAGYAGLRGPGARALAAGVLGRSLLFTGNTLEAQKTLRSAQAELGDDLLDLRRTLEAAELLTIYFGAPVGDAEERLAAWRSWDGEGALGARMIASVAAWDWAISAGPAADCAALARRALADGSLIKADPGIISLPACMTLTLTDDPAAIEAHDQTVAEARSAGSVFASHGTLLWRGLAHLRRGELDDAETDLREAIESSELWGLQAVAYVFAVFGQVLLERGDAAGAWAVLEGDHFAPEGSDQLAVLDLSRAEVLLAHGRDADAVAYAERVAERAGRHVNPALLPWRSLLARALARDEKADEALALLADELELALGFGAPHTVGRTLRIMGTIEPDGGIATLRRAVEVLDGTPARLEHAKALAALGSALRRAREPSEARGPLRAALELASACGATGLEEQVRTELHATGARPRTTALSGADSLTASERRVADMAAGGQTNREIAQALYVTPKTVEVHLSNAYRKLGITSRRHLPAALAA